MATLQQKVRKNPESVGNSPIFICEGGLVVKNLTTEEEEIRAYRLRHRIFAQELRWVPQSENALEKDDYDDYATPFGVFDLDGKMLAYIRLISSGYQMMIEKEFKSLISPEHIIQGENAVEISRLCVEPEVRSGMLSGNFGVYRISMFLYKGIYHWCIKNSVQIVYAVIEDKIWRMTRAAGFPSKLMGEPQIMPDGVKACAVIMDWREFEALNVEKRPDMLRWFTQYRSALAAQRQRRPETYLQHQVFA